MSTEESVILKQAEGIEEYVVGIQEDLHMHPEVSGEETRTITKIISELEGMGLQCEVVPNGGIISIIEGGSPGKTLVLRADIDALPMKEDDTNLKMQKKIISKYDDAAHTCGHDGHTAMLLGAAKILVRQRENIKGRLILAFEQGEEDGRGIVGILRRILEIGADGVWGIHLKADMPSGAISVDPGPRMAGAFLFDVKIIGNGGHGARPDLASTPLDVFTDFYNNLKSMRMNSLDPFKAITFSIGSVNSGSNHNVIPDSLNFKGTFRYLHHDQGKRAEIEFRERLDKIAALHHCSYEYIQEPNAIDLSVYNNKDCAEIAREAVERSLGKEVLYNYPAWMASEPFAFYQKYLPGVFAFIGIENAEKGTGAGHHHPKFEIDADVLKLGVAATVQYALDFLASDEEIIFEPESKALESLAKEAGIRVFPREGENHGDSR
ncbi:amidohydrolase [Salinicoccus halitifaciens]|uniref:Amidohydrolase n=1 Tax=Salinicoccus halitifaciens TaxID=1073415 RepID=A0ABV2E8V5_9STAP|nr:amidohydrolase [Salinicoccus halitifaciens]MCD2136750.1 amidohydrolase [Salinicoccus halitifaciens]